MNNAPLQVILGVCPSKSNGYRIARNRLIKSPKLTAYERSFYLQCNLYRDAGIDGPFRVEVDAYLANPLQDLDGIFKVFLDMLQTVKAITNDRNCFEIRATKHIDKKNPRLEFRIIPIG